jgi:hypothetical protein
MVGLLGAMIGGAAALIGSLLATRTAERTRADPMMHALFEAQLAGFREVLAAVFESTRLQGQLLAVSVGPSAMVLHDEYLKAVRHLSVLVEQHSPVLPQAVYEHLTALHSSDFTLATAWLMPGFTQGVAFRSAHRDHYVAAVGAMRQALQTYQTSARIQRLLGGTLNPPR